MLAALDQRNGRDNNVGLSAVKAQPSIALVRPLINVERNSPFFLPIGLLAIAAPARAAGYEVRIIDFEFEHRTGNGFAPNEPIETFAARIAELPCPIVGLTTLADTLPTALAIGRRVKLMRPDIKIVLGGPGMYGTSSTVATLFASSVDYLCLGEGEGAFLVLLQSDLDAGSHLPGMLNVAANAGATTVPRAHTDSIGSPAYDLVDVPAYLALASPRIFDLYVGAGCTYKCSFCTTAPFWNHEFRARSPDSVFAEMVQLEDRYGIREFNLIHDNFANDKRYIEAFAAYFKEHNTRFSWACPVRPDNVPADLMERLRAAGCRSLFCGTDAGDADILRHMRKMTSSAKSYRFFRDAKAAGLGFETNTIIGYPHETDDALEASLKIVFDAIAHGGSAADVSVLQPLPGAPITSIYRNAIRPAPDIKGMYLPEEARAIIAENRDLFSGFGFIRQGTRPYEYYARLADLMRYFTRHFFRSIYFLKEKTGVPYRQALEAVSDETSAYRYGKRLGEFARSLDCAEADRSLFRSIHRFDEGLEAAKDVDVVEEITNVYSTPGRRGLTRGPCVIDIEHEVHRVFAALPRIESIPPTRVSYLFRREEDQVVVIRLKNWQRELWQDFVNSQSGDTLLPDAWVQRISARTGATVAASGAAVAAAIGIFQNDASRRSPRAEPTRRYGCRA